MSLDPNSKIIGYKLWSYRTRLDSLISDFHSFPRRGKIGLRLRIIWVILVSIANVSNGAPHIEGAVSSNSASKSASNSTSDSALSATSVEKSKKTPKIKNLLASQSLKVRSSIDGSKTPSGPQGSLKQEPRKDQGIHRAPIILKANDLKEMAGYPVNNYRFFKSNHGSAEAIPFQIDEVTRYEDFVLPQGEKPNAHEGDGVFDDLDELSFMGDDVGTLNPITLWPNGSIPDLQFEITANNSQGETGVIYVGVWFSIPPSLSPKNYVQFNLAQSQITTSRYVYNFDPKNYLVVKSIDVLKNGVARRLVDSSSFYMKADLKYFLTFLVNQSSITSKLEAYKIGPIRNIVRVSFSFVLLKLNFEMGMYTEVSFFPNSVILPAIMYNPLDGTKSLNEGSGFYYGFALSENPESLKLESTLPLYKEKSHLDFLMGKKAVLKSYTVSASNSDWFMQMDIQPSAKMIAKGNSPSLYIEKKSALEMSGRPLNRALSLGQSPINLAINFDLSNFSEGEHRVGFRLFFENESTPELLKSFANLTSWTYQVKRRLTQ